MLKEELKIIVRKFLSRVVRLMTIISIALITWLYIVSPSARQEGKLLYERGKTLLWSQPQTSRQLFYNISDSSIINKSSNHEKEKYDMDTKEHRFSGEKLRQRK